MSLVTSKDINPLNKLGHPGDFLVSDLRVKSWKNLKICMQENRKDLSAIKRNEPFCSLDLTRYFLTEKKICVK